jgi:hypothetical protein
MSNVIQLPQKPKPGDALIEYGRQRLGDGPEAELSDTKHEDGECAEDPQTDD